MLLSIVGIVIFIFVLMVSVVLHEAGHMVAARKLGLVVPRFFAGFGKTVFSFHRGGTEYGLKALPLGGFVEIHDTTREDEKERSLLNYVSPWKRIIVFAAGPIVNLVLGALICTIALMSFPFSSTASTNVSSVIECEVGQACGAHKAGIQAGDKLVSIDGVSLEDRGTLIASQIKGKQAVDVEVLRKGQKTLIKAVPVEDDKLGVKIAIVGRRLGPIEAAAATGRLAKLNVDAVLALPSKMPAVIDKIMARQTPATEQAPASVVGAGKVYSDLVAMSESQLEELSGFKAPSELAIKSYMLMMYSAMINFGLGLINLVPLLPLDGGRIAVALLDWVRQGWAKVSRRLYRPLSYRANLWLMSATGAIVVAFSLAVLTADIVSLIV